MPIFDQGYQHWQGQLAGNSWRWLAIARHGVRVGTKNRLVRVVLILAWVRALALAGAISIWGLVEQKSAWAIGLLSAIPAFRGVVDDPISFRLTAWSLCFHYFIHIELFFAMILVVLIGPSLISQDLRFNALPLYFSRPVRRIDYFLGKLGIIGAYLAMVVVAPGIIAWFLGILFSLDFRVIFDTWRILFGMIAYGVVVTFSAGLLMLALSSLSRNSRYVGAIWAGVWIVTNIVSGILDGIHVSEAMQRQFQFAHQQGMRNQNAAWQKDIAEDAEDNANANMAPAERERRRQVRQQRQFERQLADGAAQRKAQREMQRSFSDAFRDDWRPCVSYTSNLTRIGDGLLGYYRAQDQFNAMWQKVGFPPRRGGFQPAGIVEEEDASDDVPISEPRWPWQWSALVLLALGGLSVWILNMRVKNLDRLR
jgi:hypothetical protein